MSPEQLRGAAVDERSDTFAFGAIVHEMLTGALAFSGSTPIDTKTAVLESDPQPLSDGEVPPALKRIVDTLPEQTPRVARIGRGRGNRIAGSPVKTGAGGYRPDTCHAHTSYPVANLTKWYRP